MPGEPCRCREDPRRLAVGMKLVRRLSRRRDLHVRQLLLLAEAAETVDTMVFLPENTVTNQGLAGPNVVPMIAPGQIGNIESHGNGTRMIEMTSWNLDAWNQVKEHPLLVSVRLPFSGDWKSTMMEMVDEGVSIIHLESDYHGDSKTLIFKT